MSLLRAITLGIKRDFLYTRRIEKGVQNPGETLKSGAEAAGISPCS